MDVKVTMRKTVSATDRPTKSEKSVAIISSCLAAKSKKRELAIVREKSLFTEILTTPHVVEE